MNAPGTFLNAPRAEHLDGCRIAALGLPFDMGRHPTRVGARSGPEHVRAHSALVAEHLQDLDIDLIDAVGFRDAGDVDLTPGDVTSAYPAIETAVSQLLAAGVIPLCVGGDGAVSLPQLRALARVHGPVSVVHFDAHTDAYPHDASGREPEYSNANPYRHAVDERLVDAASSFHIGVRDTELDATPGVVGVARDLGYRVIPMSEFITMSVSAVLTEVRAATQGRPTFLCWDMDVFDPSVAPGVVTPAWGGITTREGLQLLEGLRGLHFVGFEVNTVSPPHDVMGQTGALAAHVMREFLMLAHADSADSADPAGP